MSLESIYTDIILEHSQSDHNKRHLDCATCKERGHNPSCGDDIVLELIVKDDIVEDAAFTGTGCAISQASTSMMIDLINGKSVEEATILADTFLNMIKKIIEEESDLEILEDAVAFKNISNMPARVKCAVLAWHTLKEAIKSKQN